MLADREGEKVKLRCEEGSKDYLISLKHLVMLQDDNTTGPCLYFLTGYLKVSLHGRVSQPVIVDLFGDLHASQDDRLRRWAPRSSSEIRGTHPTPFTTVSKRLFEILWDDRNIILNQRRI